MHFRVFILLVIFLLNSSVYAKSVCKSQSAFNNLVQLNLNKDLGTQALLKGLDKRSQEVYFELQEYCTTSEELSALIKFLKEKLPKLNLNEKQTNHLMELLKTKMPKKMILKHLNSDDLTEVKLKKALKVYENPKTSIYVDIDKEKGEQYADIYKLDQLKKNIDECMGMCEQTLKTTRFIMCLNNSDKMCNISEPIDGLTKFSQYLANINSKDSSIGEFLKNIDVNSSEIFSRIQSGCYEDLNSCVKNFDIANFFENEKKISNFENILLNVRPILGIDQKKIKSYVLDDIFNSSNRNHSSISDLDHYDEGFLKVLQRIVPEVKSVSAEILEQAKKNQWKNMESILIDLNLPYSKDSGKDMYKPKLSPRANVRLDKEIRDLENKLAGENIEIRSGLGTFEYDPKQLPCPRNLNCFENNYFVEVDLGVLKLKEGRRGSVRMVMNKKTGDIFVTFDHYKTFHYLSYLSPDPQKIKANFREYGKSMFENYPHITVVDRETP